MKLLLALIGFLPLANAYGISCSTLSDRVDSMKIFPLTRPMKVGDVFKLNAYAKADKSEKYIVVNFYEGDSRGHVKKKYISLSVLVNVDSGKTSFNTLSAEGWYDEEPKKSPIKSGRDYELEISAHEREYQIFINGKLFQRYSYRRKFKKSVTHIGLRGIRFTAAKKSCSGSSIGDDDPNDTQLILVQDGNFYRMLGPFTAFSQETTSKGRD
ncbi:unnamed protein product [Caenorhabditis auriculariae]|uniref:Galectin n=1 Tax=Caenorhabditis auriculariae TaxID=2777116 RepID=A0A8S1H499_9PELO|nr:unnamed protein product [Caenorhabditis auriculariae]